MAAVIAVESWACKLVELLPDAAAVPDAADVPVALVDWVAPLEAARLFKSTMYWNGLEFRLLTLLRLDTTSTPSKELANCSLP